MQILKAALAIAASTGALSMTGQTIVKQFEVSPSVGYVLGGTVYDFSPGSPNPFSYHGNLADHVSYGVRLGYKTGEHLEPEFQWTRVESALQGFLRAPLTLDYLLAGVTYNFTPGPTQPYASVSLGAVRLSPIYPGLTSNETGADLRFTGSLGLGLKHFLTPSIGLRVEARGYASHIAGIRFGPICTTFVGSNPDGPFVPVNAPCPAKPWLVNGEFGGGLVVAF